jgi:site-specific DNA-cytosine methylase
VIELLEEFPPVYLALENVPGFAGSRAHRRLRRVLGSGGFEVRESLLCPTELGIPNRRRRFYLVAGRRPLAPASAAPAAPLKLRDLLDEAPLPDLRVRPGLVSEYRHALDVVEADEPAAVTACFTSAYGRSPVRSGSYLQTPDGLRRFSPREILRLLGYPEESVLPADLSLQSAWRLVGNGLSVPVVRRVLEAIPELGPA